MESIRIKFKSDALGNPIYARVSWSKAGEASPKAIALAYHGGGLIVGSSEIIPQAQTKFLTEHGFCVVAPNYRLCPQVTAKEVVEDCEEAYDWAISALSEIMQSEHGVQVDSKRIVTFGHSTGGTLAMLIGASRPVKAATAFYPTLYTSDASASAHQPCSVPPFSLMPPYEPSKQDWESITPASTQLSEWELSKPGTIPSPRGRWQGSLLKNGRWLSTICPDHEFAGIDPLTKLHDVDSWPAVMIVQGDADNIPGSGIDLARRACDDLRTAGVKEVSLETVKGAPHMFDLQLTNTDVGPGWDGVVKGLDWLTRYV